MTLLNGILAFGAAAFTIPLLIHLLNRNRFKTVDWGAMQLLQSTRNLNSRRMQWKQLLLLLLRCALPVLLALAMSRPLLHSLLSADGQSAISLAIVLDDSMSMFANEADQTGEQSEDGLRFSSRFSLACRSAAELIDGLPAGSNAMVVLGGSKPETISEHVPDLLAARMRAMGTRRIPAGEFALEQSLRPSLQWLSTSPNPRRQIVLISDFQKQEWSEMLTSQMPDARKLLTGQEISPTFSFLRIGQVLAPNQPASQNLAIDSIEVSPSVLAIEREAFLSVVVGNHGPTRSDSVVISLLVDDIEIERQQIVIDADSKTRIRARWAPKQVGDHIVRASILGEDALNEDNTLCTVAVVQEPQSVLIVDGDLKNEPMQSEADFLRVALSPFSLLGGKKGDTFASKTVSPEQWNEASLKSVRAVCLCNVRDLNEDQQKWLRNFVEQGGGLLIFLGDKVNTEQYQRWPSVTNNGLRIARFSQREKIPMDDAASRVKTQQVEFSPIRELSSVSLSSLASVRFEYRTPIELDTESLLSSSDTSVALRFEDGRAYLLESRIGKGRCLWMSSSCDDDDSNLPSRSIFVPLMQKLAAYACTADPPLTHITSGETWTRSLGNPDTKLSDVQGQFIVTRPDGVAVPVQTSDEGKLQFNQTRLQGIYVVKPVQREPSDAGLNQWVVCVRNKPPSSVNESNLSSLNSDEMKSLAALGQATVSNNTREFLTQTRADWHGREAWTWIWMALVVCFLAEMALEQSLAPRTRRTTHAVGRQNSQGAAA